jgi:hypothetical protein
MPPARRVLIWETLEKNNLAFDTAKSIISNRNNEIVPLVSRFRSSQSWCGVLVCELRNR